MYTLHTQNIFMKLTKIVNIFHIIFNHMETKRKKKKKKRLKIARGYRKK